MIARRPVSATLGLLCVLVCVLAVGVVPAGAVTQFGKEGSGPGEFENAYGVAVDQAAGGDVFVSDRIQPRVEKFDATGGFLSEFGSHRFGPGEGTGLGEFEGAQGVAVDNELGSLSYGDVYVVDRGNFRVQKFTASGEFLSMFGGGVNEKTDGDVCVVGEACTTGTSGTADGQFEWSDEGSYIAVGPDGRVYVGDKARVQVFEPSGVWRENIPLAGLSATGEVTALAVDGSGDMFVKDSQAAGVREFAPDGSEMLTQFDTGSTTVTTIAVDGSGDLFVGDLSGGFHLLEYGPAGSEVASFGAKTQSNGFGMAFAETSGQLYVSGVYEGEPKIWIYSPPLPGPLLEPGSVSAAPGLRGHATFEAAVNPEGNETKYRYEYVDEAQFQANGFAGATSTPEASIGSGFEAQSASAAVEGLIPGATYRYRIVASNSAGTRTGPEQSFEETPSALVGGPWAADVASTSATLAASVDPLGASTEYRLEWGASSSYGHVLSGNVGEGMGEVQLSYHLQGLAADTIYHYRIVTVSEVGTIDGSDHTFTTQPAASELALSDGRAWELVTPPDKKGAVIEPFAAPIQAASDGSGIAYPAEGPAVGEGAQGKTVVSMDLSRRGSDGWATADIEMPRRNVNEGESAFALTSSGQAEYGLFSPDLSSVVAEPSGDATPLLSAEATERTLYLRDNENGSFLPLVTPADVPSGVKFGGEESVRFGGGGNLFQRFITATPDLSHALFESPLALTPEAGSILGCLSSEECGLENIYEWGGGRLQLVNILPDGEPTTHEPKDLYGAVVAGSRGEQYGLAVRPVSANGRWVAWTWGTTAEFAAYKGLYVRDMVAGKTFSVGGAHAVFQAMSSDGSRVFFLENGDLYMFDTATDTQSDLTANYGASEVSAGVQEYVSDVSEDGSHVYFVATGVLADGGVSGEDNLYLLHYTGSEWTTTFIATLSSSDERSWYSPTFGGGGVDLLGVSSRVSPDGRYLAFMSDRSLTGYDNLDANSGQPDEEVYLYDSASGRLVCASCNPTGARPVGIHESSGSKLLVDKYGFWEDHWLAGSIPGWGYRENERALYQSRYLSDDGRLFFNSEDALVPQDTNGLEDVYEYEPPAGTGMTASDNCTTVSSAFSERSDGCVSLISSGASGSESDFYDASENGDDVFFITASRLTASDYDNTYDVYDAHACSAEVPCVVEPVSPPPCTSGDSCKAAPSPQPEIFGPAPSATFSGVGNIVEEAKGTVKGKQKAKAKAKSKKHPKHRKHKAKAKAKRARDGRASGKGGVR